MKPAVNLIVRNVPAELGRRIKVLAAMDGCSQQDWLLRYLNRTVPLLPDTCPECGQRRAPNPK